MILVQPQGALIPPFRFGGGSVWAWIGISDVLIPGTFTLDTAATYLDGASIASTYIDGAKPGATYVDGAVAASTKPG